MTEWQEINDSSFQKGLGKWFFKLRFGFDGWVLDGFNTLWGISIQKILESQINGNAREEADILIKGLDISG